MYTHSMGVWLAVKYGMAEAMLLGYFYRWICHNETKQHNYREGRYWTFDSVRELHKKFPYISIGKIVKITNMFVNEGILLKGNFNKLEWDKTVWYALTDKGRKMMDDLAQCSDWEESCEKMNGTCSQYEQGVHSMNEGVHGVNDNTNYIHQLYPPINIDDDDNIKQTKKRKKVNQKFEPSFENPAHAKAADDWGKYMGIPLTQGLAEQITDLVDEVGGDIFLEALKVASSNNVRRLKYIETVAVNMLRGDDYGSNQGNNTSAPKPAGKPGRKKTIKGNSVSKLGDYI